MRGAKLIVTAPKVATRVGWTGAAQVRPIIEAPNGLKRQARGLAHLERLLDDVEEPVGRELRD